TLCETHRLAAQADRATRERRADTQTAGALSDRVARRTRRFAVVRGTGTAPRGLARQRHPRNPLRDRRCRRPSARRPRQRRPAALVRQGHLAASPRSRDAARAVVSRDQPACRPSLPSGRIARMSHRYALLSIVAALLLGGAVLATTANAQRE